MIFGTAAASSRVRFAVAMRILFDGMFLSILLSER
jgi:hypothetical protein